VSVPSDASEWDDEASADAVLTQYPSAGANVQYFDTPVAIEVNPQADFEAEADRLADQYPNG
jgi:hypothetical protein